MCELTKVMTALKNQIGGTEIKRDSEQETAITRHYSLMQRGFFEELLQIAIDHIAPQLFVVEVNFAADAPVRAIPQVLSEYRLFRRKYPGEHYTFVNEQWGTVENNKLVSLKPHIIQYEVIFILKN